MKTKIFLTIFFFLATNTIAQSSQVERVKKASENCLTVNRVKYCTGFNSDLIYSDMLFYNCHAIWGIYEYDGEVKYCRTLLDNNNDVWILPERNKG